MSWKAWSAVQTSFRRHVLLAYSGIKDSIAAEAAAVLLKCVGPVSV